MDVYPKAKKPNAYEKVVQGLHEQKTKPETTTELPDPSAFLSTIKCMVSPSPATSLAVFGKAGLR
jgi:hypothetical protein